MKKIIASAVGLMLVGGVAATSAFAVESQFGGYWRTRIYFADNFTQPDSAQNATDTRTRLYYTAKFNDDLKFVNKFEYNTSYGDNHSGDMGADGKGIFRIKNSYVDATFGKVNTKLGYFTATVARGFVFSDDQAGFEATADFGMVKVPVLYSALSSIGAGVIGWDGGASANVSFTTNGVTTGGFGDGSGDIHLLSVMPQIKVNDSLKVTPHATYVNVTNENTDLYYLGVDADLKLDTVSAWFTGVYNGGKFDALRTGATSDTDVKGYLVAGGADVDLGMASVRGTGFYASGDDDPNDNEIKSYVFISGPGSGSGYYWSEILGNGVFDNPINADTNDGGLFQTDKMTNVWALNAGVTVKPMDKMAVDFDIWYAQLAKAQYSFRTNQMEDKLGTELDGKLSYMLMDDLKAELIFAYLISGDAVGPKDVMETGVQLSLSF